MFIQTYLRLSVIAVRHTNIFVKNVSFINSSFTLRNIRTSPLKLAAAKKKDSLKRQRDSSTSDNDER